MHLNPVSFFSCYPYERYTAVNYGEYSKLSLNKLDVQNKHDLFGINDNLSNMNGACKQSDCKSRDKWFQLTPETNGLRLD